MSDLPPAPTRGGVMARAGPKAPSDALEALRAAGSDPTVRRFLQGTVIVFDHDLRYLSSGGLDVTEEAMSQAVLEGRTVFEVFPPDVAAEIEPQYRLVLAGHESTVDVPFGDRCYVQRLVPLRDGDGTIVAGIGFTEDVTAARRYERALLETVERFRLAFEHGPIGRSLVGLDGHYEQVNHAMCEISGYTEEALLELNCSEVTHPDDAAADRRSMGRLLSGEVPSCTLDQRFVAANGKVVWVSKSASLVCDEDGSPLHFVVDVQDITERKGHERDLGDERRRLYEAQSVGRTGSWERDVATNTSIWSEMFLELYGVDREQFRRDPGTVTRCIDPRDRDKVAGAVESCVVGGEPMRVRFRVRRANDGERRWFDARSEALFENGRVARVAGSIVDVTEQVLAQYALEESEVRFRLAFDTAPVAMAMVELSGGPSSLLRVNPAMCTLTGRTHDELCALDFDAISHPDDAATNRMMADLLTGGDAEVVHSERRFCRPDGSTVWGELAMSVVSPSDGKPPYGICLVEDVTARKRAEGALVYQSLHDPLTALPNRRLLQERVEHALAASGGSAMPIGVIYIDLDGFKQVNDSAGHAAGDELLMAVAERLRHVVRAGDTVARIGGDEFAIVCTDPGIVDDLDGPRTVAGRVLKTIALPFELASGTHLISASIGLAVADAASDAEQLLSDADAAMYVAKSAGKNRIAGPRVKEHARAAKAALLLPELEEALARGQLVMFGQPVIDLTTGTTIAVETLIRWRHPARGVLPPSEFLDVVEHSPLMIPVGQRALTESCRMAARWGDQFGPGAPDVHVNVSGRQLESGDFASDVLSALTTYELDASRLVLELTETHMPVITDSFRTDLNRLRDRGVRIAIDDLGTGYSSLARITQLPVDILKIDLSFTAKLGKDPACDAVVRAILSMGQAMGLSVVAEGVETPEQAHLLRSYGCEAVQGYLYSRPRPEPELLAYLADHTTGETDARSLA